MRKPAIALAAAIAVGGAGLMAMSVRAATEDVTLPAGYRTGMVQYTVVDRTTMTSQTFTFDLRDQKLPVVYDSVGKDTFMKSLDCLRPRGLMVSFGQSSGPVGPVDLGIFAQKGSLFFTRPTLNTYAAARGDLLAMAKDLFDVVLSGAVKIEINQTYPLKEAAQAHRDLESRKTVGSTVFTV